MLEKIMQTFSIRLFAKSKHECQKYILIYRVVDLRHNTSISKLIHSCAIVAHWHKLNLIINYSLQLLKNYVRIYAIT